MAFTTSYKMLLRKGGFSQSILIIALLVAILASTNVIVNYLSIQSEVLSRLVNPGRTHLILSENATSLTDSRLNKSLTEMLINTGFIKQIFPQKILTVQMTANSVRREIQLRGVGDVAAFLKARRAHINGSSAKSREEANIGEILAKTLSICQGDEILLKARGGQVKVKILGVFRSQTQIDTEIILPIETAETLAGENQTITLIEFTIKEDMNSQEALSQIAQLLPQEVRLIQAQQLKEFTQQMNLQTLKFLNVWSIVVYAVVVAASYMMATRLIAESGYELAMLRALGARKHLIFALILTYTAAVAFLGSVLGMALGIAGVQIASTVFRWIQPGVDITPFLRFEQAAQTILLTLASSTLGCMYPALKSAHAGYVEQPL